MGIEQPYGNQPTSVEDYVVNETVTLENQRGEKTYASWDIDASNGTIRGRAIARDGENIRLVLMEDDEFEYYQQGRDFWYESQSQEANSTNFEERLSGEGEYVLVVESNQGAGNDGIEVSVEIWED